MAATKTNGNGESMDDLVRQLKSSGKERSASVYRLLRAAEEAAKTGDTTGFKVARIISEESTAEIVGAAPADEPDNRNEEEIKQAAVESLSARIEAVIRLKRTVQSFVLLPDMEDTDEADEKRPAI